MNIPKRVLIWADFGLNVLRGGLPAEPISAWVYRQQYQAAIKAINFIFRDENHCRDSYQAVKDGNYLPQEYKE
jgi:hypothetical protein